MDDDVLLVERTCILERTDDVPVRVLDVLTCEVGHFVGEQPLKGNRHREGGDLRGAERLVIILAEGRRLMHQARSVVRSDVVAGDDDECALLRLLGKVWKERLVATSGEGGARHPLQHFEVVALAVMLEPVRREIEHEITPAVVHPQVFELRSDTDRQVGRQGPGRGGPDREVRVLVGELQQDRDRRILHFLVVEIRLEVGQPGAQCGRDRDDLLPLVDEPLVEELLHHPPHGLHVPGVHRLVVVIEVDPAADARDGLAPLARESLHDRAACVVVAGNAKGVDQLVGVHALGFVLLVDLLLDGEAVTVPSEAATDVAPLHGEVARDNVLDRRRDKVAVMRQARGERRAVIEDVGLSVPGLFERTFEDALAPPEVEYFQFGGNEIERVTARRCDGGGQGRRGRRGSVARNGWIRWGHQGNSGGRASA